MLKQAYLNNSISQEAKKHKMVDKLYLPGLVYELLSSLTVLLHRILHNPYSARSMCQDVRDSLA